MESMTSQPKILIVDDESITRITIEALLSSENYSLHFAENGLQGFSMAAQLQPDIILLDVMMPGMNGFETCKQIRSMPSLAEVPIILITALDDREAHIAGLKAGADDFVTKPFDIHELLLRIQNMIRLNRYRLLTEQRQEMEHLNHELLVAYDKTIEGWSRALDLRDKETEGHTKRVTEMTLQLARKAGFNNESLKHVWRGALLHDVGKLGIPDAILLKADKLTEVEWGIMRMHPVYAYEWLSHIKYLQPALDIPFCHHERWDGTGYPRKLKGEEIPLAARLFAIVDVWDALTSDRPYRKAITPGETWEYIQSQSGKYFDPKVFELFSNVFSDLKPKSLR
jgi:putative two-component system response regulator